MSRFTIAGRVARGVALLDERGPQGWRDKIDLDRLDIIYNCVLDQVFGDFTGGMEALGLRLFDNQSTGYGFNCGGDEKGAVEAEWRRVLVREGVPA